MMELSQQQVQQRLREEMNTRGWNQARLAKHLNISPTMVNLALNGHRRPAGRLLAFLGLEQVVTYSYRARSLAEAGDGERHRVSTSTDAGSNPAGRTT